MSDTQHIPKQRSLVLVDWFTLMVGDKTVSTSPYNVPWDAVFDPDNMRNFDSVYARIQNEYWSTLDSDNIYMNNALFVKFIINIAYSTPSDDTTSSIYLLRNDENNSTPSTGFHSCHPSFAWNNSTGVISRHNLHSGFIPVKNNDYFTLTLIHGGTGDASIIGVGGGGLQETNSWMQVELYDYL